MSRRAHALSSPAPLAVAGSNLTVIAAPLIIMALLASGYVLIYLKDVLVPFFIALFLVYLLRPLVWLLDVPFNCFCRSTCRVWRCVMCQRKRDSRLSRASASSADGVEMVGGESRSVDAVKVHVAYSPVPEAKAKARRAARRARDGKQQRAVSDSTRRHPPRAGSSDECPHWIASIVALMIAGGVAGAILFWLVMTIISVDTDIYNEISEEWHLISNITDFWFGVKLDVDKNTVLRTIHDELPVGQIVHKVLFTVIERCGDLFFVLLGTIYMMLDSAGRRTKASPLRANIERQIQRYIGLKSFVSALNGVAVYSVLGPLLHIPAAFGIGILVRRAALCGSRALPPRRRVAASLRHSRTHVASSPRARLPSPPLSPRTHSVTPPSDIPSQLHPVDRRRHRHPPTPPRHPLDARATGALRDPRRTTYRYYISCGSFVSSQLQLAPPNVCTHAAAPHHSRLCSSLAYPRAHRWVYFLFYDIVYR